MTGAFGATAGTVIGILRQKPVAGYAFSGALNASLFGMTFVGMTQTYFDLTVHTSTWPMLQVTDFLVSLSSLP